MSKFRLRRKPFEIERCTRGGVDKFGNYAKLEEVTNQGNGNIKPI